MIDEALPYLRCPVCEQSLGRADRTLRCPRGHSFDLARQGYADLSGGRLPHDGDTAEMVVDRAAFLAAGHYDFIADALATHAPPPTTATGHTAATHPTTGHTAATHPPVGHPGETVHSPNGNRTGHSGDLIIDAGTGTGDYLARVLSAARGAVGLGVDVSKPALRRAAQAHPRAAAIRADLWRRLPVSDGVAALILNVFAPRNGPEYHRVLRPDGLLLVVTPAADHLRELIAAHGLIRVDPDKASRVAEALGEHFTLESATLLRRELRLTAAETRTLIGMTPSARHVPVAALPTEAVPVTAAVHLTAYRPR